MPNQLTIAKKITLEGIGLHSGEKTEITLKPLPENSGVWFSRVDLKGKPRLKADIDNVIEIERGTTLGISEVEGGPKNIRVQTVEHLLASLAACEIDNIQIDVKGEEIPIFDGSAAEFFKAIKKVGTVEQPAEKRFIVIKEPLLYEEGDKAISLFKSDEFRLTFMIDYNYPQLGAQHTTLFHLGEFEAEYSTARTFCFLSEIMTLFEKGLVKGGSLNNAVVIQDRELSKSEIKMVKKALGLKQDVRMGKNGFLNDTKLRFPNELCRHKAVDLLGDFYLIGAPLKAQVMAARSGHAHNIRMVKKMREAGLKPVVPGVNTPVMDIHDIKNILPHRYPFLLVDRVLEISDDNKKIIAYKNITANEEFFNGHFPHLPIMPGVLQVEAMAQAGGLLLSKNITGDTKGLNTIFLGIENCRFRNMVKPGDQLIIEAEILSFRRGISKLKCRTLVDNKVASEAELKVMYTKDSV